MSLNGILVVDKPAGFTSHDVVARMRRVLGERAIGHLGTLDPMATGVLPLVIGRMTRIAQFYGDSVKSYDGEIRLGFATDTYDADGEAATPETPHRPHQEISLEELRAASARFVGPCEQMPPPFSAKKINGVPAYKLARNKQEVELNAVLVHIHEFELVVPEVHDFSEGRFLFRSVVSSGTYLRTIAHELGQALGSGAHLSSLRRTRVAEFALDEAHTLAEIESSADREALLFHLRRVLPEMPSVTANEEQAAWIRNGRAVNLPELSRSKLVKVFSSQTELLAIASRVAGTLFHPKVVLGVVAQ